MPILSRREKLQSYTLPSLGKDVHPGLWFDKFTEQHYQKNEPLGQQSNTPQQKLVEEVAGISITDPYRHFFQRWKIQLNTMRVQIEGYEYVVELRQAVAKSRLAIGLGDESVIETAVTLHHTYGVPYIPGSALKGLASSFAHQRLEDPRWRKNGMLHQHLFGTTESAGYVTFFDALLDPTSIEKPLAIDVITVHHPRYYQGQGEATTAPADWDSPTPIFFLTSSGSFLVALGGPPAWVNAAFDILHHALAEYGIGAKTSSGYGRMALAASIGQNKQSSAATPVTQVAQAPQAPQAPPGIQHGSVLKCQRGYVSGDYTINGRKVRAVEVTVRDKDFKNITRKRLTVIIEHLDGNSKPNSNFDGVVQEVDDTQEGHLFVLVRKKK